MPPPLPAFAAPLALRAAAADTSAAATRVPAAHRAPHACAEPAGPAQPAPAPAPARSARAARGRARLTATRLGDAALATENVMPLGSSPALEKRAPKYIFPMRADNTEVFFDQGVSDTRTLMVVFCEPHHGLYLDCLSVLKALGVKCWRIAGSGNDVVQVVTQRIEGELVSLEGLGLSLDNCVAFWITDGETGEKISDDVERLDQITACIKMELQAPNCRPAPASPHAWHRVTVELDRSDMYTIFNLQTSDRPNLLAEMSRAFASCGVNVVSAAIETLNDRVENAFFVRGANGHPLGVSAVEELIEELMKAVLRVGEKGSGETLWYQVRCGSAVVVAEALFIDDVCNKTLATFAKVETPNFRGRLPDAPYKPVSLQ